MQDLSAGGYVERAEDVCSPGRSWIRSSDPTAQQARQGRIRTIYEQVLSISLIYLRYSYCAAVRQFGELFVWEAEIDNPAESLQKDDRNGVCLDAGYVDVNGTDIYTIVHRPTKPI